MFRYVYEEKPILELLPSGEANFKILDTALLDRNGIPFKNGSMQLKLSLNANGKTNMINALISGDQKYSWVVKSLMDSIGHPEWYSKAGYIDNLKLIGCVGKCILEIYQDKNGNQKNMVKKWLPAPPNIVVNTDETPVENSNSAIDDDLPF